MQGGGFICKSLSWEDPVILAWDSVFGNFISR